MTDQPIIYWQDDDDTPFLHLTESTQPSLPFVCELFYDPSRGEDSTIVGLTRDQARSLGYALIARATVTTDGTTQTCDDGHQWSDTLGCVTIPE
jgi:hypothetical protein